MAAVRPLAIEGAEMMPELLGSYFIETWELVLRLLLAAGLGFLVGLDRSIKNKPLGFRPRAIPTNRDVSSMRRVFPWRIPRCPTRLTAGA